MHSRYHSAAIIGAMAALAAVPTALSLPDELEPDEPRAKAKPAEPLPEQYASRQHRRAVEKPWKSRSKGEGK